MGTLEFPAGTYVYAGSARRALSKRVARHRRRLGKKHRWHIDPVREQLYWLGARTWLDAPAARRDCDVAEAVAALPDAQRYPARFGSSDCRCGGHLVYLPERLDPAALGGASASGEPLPGRLVARDNRFVARVELEGGEVIRTYVPNTARLHGVLDPGCDVLVTPTDDPRRATRWTTARVVGADSLVSLEASKASDLMARYLAETGALPELGDISEWRREVKHDGHRLDFQLTLAKGDPAWLEVKSLSIRDGQGRAVLSRTPSTRGAAHLAALGAAAENGTVSASAFVLQRGDVSSLVADDGADHTWLAAVRAAAARGVHVLAFRCGVAPLDAWIDAPVSVTLDSC